VRQLTLLYETADLPPYARRFLERAPKHVPLRLVAVRGLCPGDTPRGLDAATLAGRLTLIDDAGNVWRDRKAELVVLWALRGYRRRALLIGHPSRMPFRRANLNWVAGGSGEPWPDRAAHGDW
jgi:hypothetical protein